MPDLWMDVDSNLAEVPINILPLIDDTDFKSIEASLVYNQAGLDLVWCFVTTAGAFSETAVTPTDTGGNYDWVNQGDGYYTIEIPASGGASINNDTEGFGWFKGFATGVLPWRGPIIGFRAAGLNNLLIDDAFSATRGLVGTALPAAAADGVGGVPISDAGGLDMDAILARIGTPVALDGGAATLGSMLTKMADDNGGATFDATNDSQDKIAAAVAAVDTSLGTMAPTSDASDAFSQTYGTVVSGTYVNTQSDDNNPHILAPEAVNGLDATYTFTCGTGRAPTAVAINGYWSGNGRYCDVYAKDVGLDVWDKLTNSATRMAHRTSDQNYVYQLNREHMDLATGNVYIRFVSPSVTLADRLRLDRILVNTVPDATASSAGGITAEDIWKYAERTLSTATGEPATTAEIADAVLDEVVTGSYTLRQLVKVIAAVLAAKSSGGGTATYTIRDLLDATDIVVATLDTMGNRENVAITVS